MKTKAVPYSGDKKWVHTNTIFLTVHGSRAYGTHRPDSDYDLKGLVIPPREYFMGFMKNPQKVNIITREPYDMVLFGLRKFMTLAADCNPNIIEVLFTDPKHHWICTPLADKLLANRRLFLSQKAKHTFSGYAMSQLKRMRNHRRWLRDPPNAPPSRKEMGLPPKTVIPKDQLATAQAMIQKQVDRWEWKFTDENRADRLMLMQSIATILAEMSMTSDATWKAAGRTVGFNENFLELLELERKYANAKKEWKSFQGWKRDRNPARAAIEAEFGVDLKHAYHLIRLLRMCREIITTGEVIVTRPDAEELLAIRNGAWTADEIIDWAEKEDKAMAGLLADSPLPYESDKEALDELCRELISEHFGITF